jgi:fatty acid-binding protein DegV
MSNKVAVVIDSTAYLPEETQKQYNITITPLSVIYGTLEAVEKVHTKQKAIQRVVEIVSERIKGKTPIRLAVTHANSEADASSLLESARTELNPVETFCRPLSPVIGTHAGPGTVALNFMSGIA